MRKCLILVVTMLGLLFAGEYQVDKQRENRVKFISDAPIEDFEGVTDQIDGYMFWEGGDLTQSSQIYFEVNLNSLDTGIGLRNRHMRENYLETDRFPITWFKGHVVRSEVTKDDTYRIQAQGNIFIHGIEKELNLEADMMVAGEGFQIHALFSVKLSDFNIEIPSIMFYKIDETMELKVEFFIRGREAQ